MFLGQSLSALDTIAIGLTEGEEHDRVCFVASNMSSLWLAFIGDTTQAVPSFPCEDITTLCRIPLGAKGRLCP